jgi:hypothetical protein
MTGEVSTFTPSGRQLGSIALREQGGLLLGRQKVSMSSILIQERKRPLAVSRRFQPHTGSMTVAVTDRVGSGWGQ